MLKQAVLFLLWFLLHTGVPWPENLNVVNNTKTRLEQLKRKRYSYRQWKPQQEGLGLSEGMAPQTPILEGPARPQVHFGQGEPVTREDFLYYSCDDDTLDPNTAKKCLHLSEGNRRVACRERDTVYYPDHPDRFDGWEQVLCTKAVSGRCYWEVERSGSVDVTVAYRSIPRKGVDNSRWFGFNGHSWSLYIYDWKTCFTHRGKQTKLPLHADRRVGVYVDHSAGTLVFYNISDNDDTMTLLHRVQTTFTEPLYLGFRVYNGDAVQLLPGPRLPRRNVEAYFNPLWR